MGSQKLFVKPTNGFGGEGVKYHSATGLAHTWLETNPILRQIISNGIVVSFTVAN